MNGSAAATVQRPGEITRPARTLADRLEALQRVTGAGELLVTTITHDHADRVHSFELFAKEWPG